MKKFRILTAFVLILSAIGFTSCETEPIGYTEFNGENPGGTTGGNLRMDFNNNTFVATQNMAIVTNGMISITGIRGTQGESVSITILGTAEGTYGDDDVLIIYQPAGSEYGYSNIASNSGTSSTLVTITSINTVDNTISGTFKFKGWWTNNTQDISPIEFTNGVFENIPFQSNGPNPNPNPGEEDEVNSLFARVDSQDFVASNLNVGADSQNTSNFRIVATTLDNRRIQLSIPISLAEGEYDFSTDEQPGSIIASYRTINGTYNNVMEGTLTVISNAEGRMKATFNFKVADNIEEGEEEENTEQENTPLTLKHTITDGEFDIEYGS